MKAAAQEMAEKARSFVSDPAMKEVAAKKAVKDFYKVEAEAERSRYRRRMEIYRGELEQWEGEMKKWEEGRRHQSK